MSSATSKARQIFNLFLLLLLLAAGAGVFLWFLTIPENRDATFWLSLGFLSFAALLGLFVASRIVLRPRGGAMVAHSFAHLYLLVLYFLFVLAMPFINWVVGFSTTTYFLIHFGGMLVFLIPLLITNMAMIRLGGADRRNTAQGRQDLEQSAVPLEGLIQELEAEGGEVGSLLDALRQLRDSLRYADPSSGSQEMEAKLSEALGRLEQEVRVLLALPGESRIAVQSKAQEACLYADQALKARNREVRESRQTL